MSADNLRTYASARVVSDYADPQRMLFPAERQLFARCALKGRILDIGVGGGRTVPALTARANRGYVGIDYSAPMVAAARERFPNVRIEQGDARDLDFPAREFDAVVFSFNGIDYCSVADRARVLVEVRRVLKPGGRFLFSSHNLSHPRSGLLPWQQRTLREWDAETVSRSLHALRCWRNRAVMRSHVQDTIDVALLNDPAHDYSLLTCYVTAGWQVRALHEAGFLEVEVFNQEGRRWPSRDSVWLYYCAVR